MAVTSLKKNIFPISQLAPVSNMCVSSGHSSPMQVLYLMLSSTLCVLVLLCRPAVDIHTLSENCHKLPKDFRGRAFTHIHTYVEQLRQECLSDNQLAEGCVPQ